MRNALQKETVERERRVALAPDAVKRLVGAGPQVAVQRGAGEAAYYPDEQYAAAGAVLADDLGQACRGAEVVAKVRIPSAEEVECLDGGAVLIAMLDPARHGERLAQIAARGVTALALEKVPRITRAQSMDVLSSQATVAGYKAVLLGAGALPRFLPMLTTAAGNITPAKAFVLGAGVAGLQAIATARRLGAVVSAFDVRAAAREQVQSLGAKFVATELAAPGAEAAGGYAREQGADERERTLAAIAGAIGEMDLVVSTAAIPGRPAPRLITAAMIATMKPGSVIVDVSAETGGNCDLTVAGETIEAHGVSIMGPINLPSTAPFHASAMFSRNVLTLLQHLAPKDQPLTIDLTDEITGAMAVTHAGAVRA